MPHKLGFEATVLALIHTDSLVTGGLELKTRTRHWLAGDWGNAASEDGR